MIKCKARMDRLRRVTVLTLMLLAGCAAQQMHEEGMALLGQGRYEEAVSKLAEAARKYPSDMQIRKDFFLAREQAVNRLVAIGNAPRNDSTVPKNLTGRRCASILAADGPGPGWRRWPWTGATRAS